MAMLCRFAVPCCCAVLWPALLCFALRLFALLVMLTLPMRLVLFLLVGWCGWVSTSFVCAMKRGQQTTLPHVCRVE